ncbi:MAG TPA: metalloregulator ArsR/SmtB family transcription factor, partial [Rhizomicrobium sp.]|nr:metalloregulator ArsR/SmtB family transcription factor [Rhizomicrobium sp.]
MLRAAGDPTRLRLLLLLRQAELTVSELVEIVGQSQPRVSRHLKLLGEAGLVERFKEGSWVFCRAADRGTGAELGAAIAALADPALQETDKARLAHVRQARANAAAAYFKSNAAEWERIRALHAPERDVEEAIARRLTSTRIENFLDAGTGTGRMLELIAPQAKRAVGIDVSPDMLAIARDRLLRENIQNAQVRLGDTYRLPFPNGGPHTGFDVVLFHQVLHYL